MANGTAASCCKTRAQGEAWHCKDNNLTGDCSLGFGKFRAAGHSWDLSVDATLPCQLPTPDVTNADVLGRALRSRGGVRRSAPRRGAAQGGAVGAGSFAKLHHPSSALVKKRPSFRRGPQLQRRLRRAPVRHHRAAPGPLRARVIARSSSRGGGVRRRLTRDTAALSLTTDRTPSLPQDQIVDIRRANAFPPTVLKR